MRPPWLFLANDDGTVGAFGLGMDVATRFEELIAWQLCYELKMRVFEFTSRPTVKREADFCRQIRKSSRSSPALIAEGFGRFRPKDFAHYVEMAIASLDETRNHLRDAADSNYITAEEFRSQWHLCQRARRASSGLHAYLRNCKAPPNDGSQPPDRPDRRKSPRPDRK